MGALESVGAEAFEARDRGDLEGADAAVLPGGESTTISSLLFERGLDVELERLIGRGGAVWGTCAGMVVLASRGRGEVERTGQKLLGLLDAVVERNAFGGQRQSFEAKIDVGGLDRSFPAVFIRAPAYVSVGPDVEVLSRVDGKVVAARSGGVLATAFHPELVSDKGLHEYFLGMAK